MKKNTKKLIAVFVDGRPGHEKQSYGVLQQLGKMVDVDAITVPVQKPSLVNQVVMLVRLFFFKTTPLEVDLSKCQMLMGTGTHTHLPMLLQKKLHGAPVVTCMTPAGYLKKHFDLIFSPKHDSVPPGGNIIQTVGPPNCNENNGKHDERSVLILVGGIDKKSHKWDTNDLINKIEAIILKDVELTYVISSSPRTPDDTITALERIAKTRDNVTFYDFKDTASGWVEKEYQRCKYVWVTADSISMVYEALSSGCCVGTIPVQWKKMENKFRKSEAYLQREGYVVDYEGYLSGRVKWNTNKTLNVASLCAEEIVRRLQWKDSI